MLRAYYAHSMLIYNTEREMAELEYLRQQFDVICPNNDIGDLQPFKKYLNLVRWADVVIISEYERHITAGVYQEAAYALKLGKQVFLIDPFKSSFKLVKVFSVDRIAKEWDYKNPRYGVVTPKEWRG